MFARTDCAGRWAKRMASIAVASFLLASAGATAASAETRTLRFYNVHTKERTEVAYKKNGRYLADGLKKINWALRDWRKSEPTNMDRQLLDLVWEAYRQSGSRDYIHVISSYRSPGTNNMLRSRSSGVAKSSQHTLGKALDFYLPDVPLRKLREVGLKMQVGGVGYYPKSGSPFVHFDVGNARHWPRMSRKELAAVFPSGGTVHVPSDGKPLPGYQQALASYKQRRSGAAVQVANAETSSGGGRSLLAALFGGGADEEEDTQIAAAPAPRARVPAAPARRAAPAPQVAVASVVPSSRPVLPAGVALPVRDDFDTSAPTPQATVPEPSEVAALDAARVPVPTWASRQAPAPAPAAEPGAETVSTLVAALAEQAAEEVPAAPAQLAYSVPTPRDRPPFAAVLKETVPTAQAVDEVKAMMMAAMPAARPAPAAAPVPVAAPVPAKPQKPAADSSRDMIAAVMSSPAPMPRPVDAVPAASAPAPSGKSGRVTASEVAPPKTTVTVDPQDAISARIEMAGLITSPDLTAAMGSMNKPDAGRLVSQVPGAVVSTGFASDAAEKAVSDRFVGSAVNFLPIAKFQ